MLVTTPPRTRSGRSQSRTHSSQRSSWVIAAIRFQWVASSSGSPGALEHRLRALDGLALELREGPVLEVVELQTRGTWTADQEHEWLPAPIHTQSSPAERDLPPPSSARRRGGSGSDPARSDLASGPASRIAHWTTRSATVGSHSASVPLGAASARPRRRGSPRRRRHGVRGVRGKKLLALVEVRERVSPDMDPRIAASQCSRSMRACRRSSRCPRRRCRPRPWSEQVVDRAADDVALVAHHRHAPHGTRARGARRGTVTWMFRSTSRWCPVARRRTTPALVRRRRRPRRHAA